MILPDVNVLIYAFRTDSEEHKQYRGWLESVINGPAACGIAPHVLASLVRITTHPKICARPSSRADVFAFCRTLLEQPNATITTPGERHWAIFEDLCKKTKANGNLAQDAWFATLAIESGSEWIRTDRDYARLRSIPGTQLAQPRVRRSQQLDLFSVPCPQMLGITGYPLLRALRSLFATPRVVSIQRV